jgi:hypothetical protein
MRRASLTYCRRRIALLWSVGFGVNFLLFLSQSVAGAFQDRLQAAWSWFLPTLVPSYTIILGALLFDAYKSQPNMTVDRFVFRLSFGLSAFYLLVLLGTLAWAPRFSGHENPMDFLEQAGLYLAALQALVGLTLGGFFGTRKEEGDLPP